MQRRNFLFTTAAAIPAIAIGQNLKTLAKGRTSKPFIIRSGNNRSGSPMMKFMGAFPNDVVISRKDTNNELSVFLFSGKRGSGVTLHEHYHQDEFFYVTEGTYRFVCGKMTEDLNAGDTIFLPRNIPHQWVQLSETGALVYAVNPAGTLEDMFVELDNLKSAPTEELMTKVLAKHGMKLLGPPLHL